MNARTKNELRMLLAILLTLATLVAGYVALTVPVFAMTGPAIVTVALAVATFFVWRSPKDHR